MLSGQSGFLRNGRPNQAPYYKRPGWNIRGVQLGVSCVIMAAKPGRDT